MQNEWKINLNLKKIFFFEMNERGKKFVRNLLFSNISSNSFDFSDSFAFYFVSNLVVNRYKFFIRKLNIIYGKKSLHFEVSTNFGCFLFCSFTTAGLQK